MILISQKFGDLQKISRHLHTQINRNILKSVRIHIINSLTKTTQICDYTVKRNISTCVCILIRKQFIAFNLMQKMAKMLLTPDYK